MTKPAEKPDRSPPAAAEPPTLAVIQPEPLERGLAAIKAEDPDALRIWEVKGPRQGGGRLLGVLLQGTGEVVIVHQMQSGRFSIYERRKPATETKAD